MKGTPYPVGKKEAQPIIKQFTTILGDLEEPLNAKLQAYPMFRIMALHNDIQLFRDAVSYTAAIGSRYGLPDSIREECTRALMTMSPWLRDLDTIYMSEIGKGLQSKDGEVYATLDSNDPLARTHFMPQFDRLLRRVEKEGKPHSETINEFKKCLYYWRDSVSDVMLTSVPEAHKPQEVAFGNRVEEIYKANSAEHWLNFYLSQGREGREIIAAQAGIEPGDTIADVGSGLGWMLPHIARYKPKIIYVSEKEHIPELDIMMRTIDANVDRTYNFNTFNQPVDIAICSQAPFFGRNIVGRMADVARKGIVIGTNILSDPAEQYCIKDGLPDDTITPIGPDGSKMTTAFPGNSELKRLEQDALQYFENVDITKYNGVFVLSARNKRGIRSTLVN